jgi:hypothetical protein
MKNTLLSPRDAAWLTEAFARNRSAFAGFQMMADPPADPPEGDDPDDGKGGKSAVLADLAKERKARQALEDQVKELAPLKEQMEALAAAFGVKPAEGDKAADTLSTMQAQIAQMQRDNAVLAAASLHGITDQADLDLLKSSALEGDALAAMAERLKPAGDDGKPTPKPDLSQGGKGDDLKPETLPGVPRLAQAFEDAFNTN